MSEKNNILASYTKIIQLVFFIIVILYLGKTLFIPLSFALLIALILYPLCNWLEKHKWPRSFAIFVSLTIVALLMTGMFLLLLWQISFLKEDAPSLIEKLKSSAEQFQQWLEKNTGFVINFDSNWKESFSLNKNMSSVLESFLMGIGNFLFSLFIIPVFTALFLYHREQFVLFLKSLFNEKYHHQIHIILHETTYRYHQYITGLIKVYLIVGTLNSIGLLLLGVEHAILFGMITAFMTIIPYLGIIISSLLPITVAWITTDSIFYPLGVVAIFAFVQYLESSVIFPKVVGKQLNVSTWIILVALIAGGIIWGVSGMVLFMPFVAILKIISDHIEEWKPLNILLSRKEK